MTGAASTPDALVAIYADESCLGNGRDGDNPGGVGVLLEFQRRARAMGSDPIDLRPRLAERPGIPSMGSDPIDPALNQLVRRDLWVSEPATTNNRMALRSVIESMIALSQKGRTFRVVFTTDSRYIVDGMNEWVHKWSRQGWTRKTGPIENLELWRRAVDAATPHAIEWRWVRGHAGHAQNEYANDLAVRAAGALSLSSGLVESGFDAWLAERAAKGKALAPEPFPDAALFRAARPLPTHPAASP